MNPNNEKYSQALQRLLSIMNELRAKCPWDKKQTLESLRHLTIEETYELSDAILEGNSNDIKEELGDLLLHVVFYSTIEAEQQAFDLADVINNLCDKLVIRHPHVFGDIKVTDAAEVKHNWELIKLREKTDSQSILAGVPKVLPALIKALRIQEKISGVGFDWQHSEDVWEKVEEEIVEFKEQLADNNAEKAEQEFGDLLFTLVNYARFININPEDALEKTNKKVIKRFKYIETSAQHDAKQLPDLTLAEMDAYWDEAKQLYK